MSWRQLSLTALIAFLAAIAGVVVGRELVPAAPAAAGDLHGVLHGELELAPEQERKLHLLEESFARRRLALEQDMRAQNARLASAMATEHGNGPEVTAAVEASHRIMGELQMATLAHIFAMRQLLNPVQAAKFDAAVTKALTEESR